MVLPYDFVARSGRPLASQKMRHMVHGLILGVYVSALVCYFMRGAALDRQRNSYYLRIRAVEPAFESIARDLSDGNCHLAEQKMKAIRINWPMFAGEIGTADAVLREVWAVEDNAR